MGAAKELWMDEIERIGESFDAGEIGRDEAVAALIRKGFDHHEAETMISERAQ